VGIIWDDWPRDLFFTSVKRTPLRLAEIPPYTPDDWAADRLTAVALTCPNCGRSDDYGPREATLDDAHTLRRYRGCKVCGFWQEADGR